ncbi:MAG: hypothetical protein M3Y33_13685 [Actinomycetota bacterium]|nr:hypothetical protein [Actinomycetota bacterium]
MSRGVPGRLVRVGLRHDPAARAKAELQAVVARHDDVLLDNQVPMAAGAHDGVNGSFVIADFADAPGVVYLETACAR